MILKRFNFVLCMLATLVWVAGAHAATLSQLRLGLQPGNTVRLVAELSDKVAFSNFTLENPTRIVIDFDNTKEKKGIRDTFPAPVSFIKSMRLGYPKVGTTRFVLESSEPVKIKEGFFLTPTQPGQPWRFVLDITSTNAPAEQASTVLLPIAASAPEPKVETAKTKKPLIVLDPGHGGKDPGAISISGRYEKVITLKMAQEVKKVLEKTGKYRVLLTRNTDKALALRERVRFAHNNRADLFISIHADSARNKNARGLSVYTISEKASDKEAAMLAERENKADIILGTDLSNEAPEVSSILIDLAKRDTMSKSAHFATALVNAMQSRITLVKQTHKFAGFVVLKSTNIPSVLLELGYLSNREEDKLLATESYRAKIADSIVRAVDQYFNTIYD
ncbi:MAG: N-acetylmuramoyl-L-alanine amidase [Alphaproteobacteria bacterium]|nr:N-acetylmuramoyl-L-alanine amidase [Alphaproteobacteria bacterium]